MKKCSILLLFVVASLSVSAKPRVDTPNNAVTISTTQNRSDNKVVSNSSVTASPANTRAPASSNNAALDSAVKERIAEAAEIPVKFTNDYNVLGITIIGLIVLIIGAAIWALVKGKEWLKNALTDNTSEKKTIPNPQYTLLLGVIASNSATTQGTPAQIQAALAAAQASLAAQDAAIAAVPTDPAAVAAATATHNTNIAALGGLINPLSNSVGVMNSLIGLFPPL